MQSPLNIIYKVNSLCGFKIKIEEEEKTVLKETSNTYNICHSFSDM